jgi:hypothetical protein
MKTKLLNTLKKFDINYLEKFISTYDIYKAKRPKTETIYDFYVNVLLKDYEGDVNSMDDIEYFIKQTFSDLHLPQKYERGHSKAQTIKQIGNSYRNKQHVDYPIILSEQSSKPKPYIDEPPKKVSVKDYGFKLDDTTKKPIYRHEPDFDFENISEPEPILRTLVSILILII